MTAIDLVKKLARTCVYSQIEIRDPAIGMPYWEGAVNAYRASHSRASSSASARLRPS